LKVQAKALPPQDASPVKPRSACTRSPTDRRPSNNHDDPPPTADAATITSLANAAPVFSTLADQTIVEGALFALLLGATDADSGQTLRYALAGDYPFAMTIDPATGRIEWQSGETHGGSAWTVQITAIDDGVPAASASTSITLSVLESNQAPTLTQPWPRAISTGRTLFVAIEASDNDLPEDFGRFSLLGLGRQRHIPLPLRAPGATPSIDCGNALRGRTKNCPPGQWFPQRCVTI